MVQNHGTTMSSLCSKSPSPLIAPRAPPYIYRNSGSVYWLILGIYGSIVFILALNSFLIARSMPSRSSSNEKRRECDFVIYLAYVILANGYWAMTTSFCYKHSTCKLTYLILPKILWDSCCLLHFMDKGNWDIG